MLDTLILDIKIYISLFFEKVFYIFYKYDTEFQKYAKTKTGINLFKNTFTRITEHNYKSYTERRITLLGYIHHNELPAITRISNLSNYNKKTNKIIIYEAWYHKGIPHRDDAPAIICGQFLQWWRNGIRFK
jgi:hypothetical protein